jgi:hypothetical protein
MNRFAERDKLEQGEELPEYRPLSFAAIAALLLAWPAFLGVFHPAFLIFSIISIGLALIALRQIASSTAGVSGKRSAQIALFVSVLACALSMGLHLMNSRSEYQYALGCTERWLQLLRGENPREAYLLTIAYNMRPIRPDEDVPAEIKDFKAPFVPESQVAFHDQPAIKVLADSTSTLRYMGLVRRATGKERSMYRFVYDVHAPSATPPDYYAMIEAQMFRGPDGINYWQIGSWEMVAKDLGQPVQ